MTSQENCLKCPHHWSQFQEQARTPGHYCYLFIDYIQDCQQWRIGELGRPSSELGGHPANRAVHPSDWIILDMMARRYLRDGELPGNPNQRKEGEEWSSR